MKNLVQMSETEKEIMKKVWDLGSPVTVAQLMDVFKSKDWKTSTLSTMLKRLIEKGYLVKSMKGKTNFYYTTLTLDEYKKHEAKKLISRLYNGSIKNFIAAIADDDNLSVSDIDELKEWFLKKAGEKK